MYLVPVVQKMDSAIDRINHHPPDSAINFPNIYPLDSDFSSGLRYAPFEQYSNRSWAMTNHSARSIHIIV